MPIYEYECKSCNKIHELMQKFSDPPMTQCPECKGEVQKIISLSSFALKGSGFYTTDYKRAGKQKAETKTAENPTSEKTETKEAAVKPSAHSCKGGCSH